MRIDVSKFMYLPILKGKLGEYCGVRAVADELKPFIAPVIVVAPASDLDHERGRPLIPAEHVRLFGPRLVNSWGKRPSFIDAVNLDDEWHKNDLKDHPLSALIQRARSVGALSLPMTALDRSPEYQTAVKRAFQLDRYGIGLRLNLQNIEFEALTNSLETFLRQVDCSPSDVSLIVDFSAREFGDPAEFATLFIDRLNHLPYLNSWQLIAFSGTEFPKKIAIAPKQSKNFRRGEWRVAEELIARKTELIRPPVFSDYGIEHPLFGKGGGRGANVHLRYATSQDYKIHKGGKFKEVGYSGILEVAKTLAKADYFLGATFSAGDQMIADWANEVIPAGTPSIWRQAGVCHHLTLVVKQLVEKFGIKIPTRVPAAVQQELNLTVPSLPR